MYIMCINILKNNERTMPKHFKFSNICPPRSCTVRLEYAKTAGEFFHLLKLHPALDYWFTSQ